MSSQDIIGERLTDFAKVGGLLIVKEQSFSRHPQYQELMEKLIALGRKFLDFIHTAPVATGPAGFDRDIDSNSIYAAKDCLQLLWNLNLAPDTENLITVIDNMTTSMDQINVAVAERVRFVRS